MAAALFVAEDCIFIGRFRIVAVGCKPRAIVVNDRMTGLESPDEITAHLGKLIRNLPILLIGHEKPE